jgi:hypothetical protein
VGGRRSFIRRAAAHTARPRTPPPAGLEQPGGCGRRSTPTQCRYGGPRADRARRQPTAGVPPTRRQELAKVTRTAHSSSGLHQRRSRQAGDGVPRTSVCCCPGPSCTTATLTAAAAGAPPSVPDVVLPGGQRRGDDGGTARWPCASPGAVRCIADTGNASRAAPTRSSRPRRPSGYPRPGPLHRGEGRDEEVLASARAAPAARRRRPPSPARRRFGQQGAEDRHPQRAAGPDARVVHRRAGTGLVPGHGPT